MNSKHYIVLLIWLLISAGCRLIDDDLSVCGTESTYLINYQMRLTTEINMTIDEKLSSAVEKPIADALKTWSEPIFSGQAHDLDMSFYSLDGTDELKHHQFEIIDATRKSYTLTIPRQDYQHLAVVNISDNKNVTLAGSQHAATMRVLQSTSDTLPSHSTAVYTARLPMYMDQVGDTTFDVRLYMVSCAVALVIDTPSVTMPPIRLFLGGTASQFNVLDSAYTYSSPSLIRAEKVMDRCYAMVALPSRDSIAAAPVQAKRCIQTASTSLWELRAYVDMPGGTVTETILTVDTPLKAGTMEIIKVQMAADGALIPIQNAHVGASVTLDWKQGSTQEIEL